MQTFISETLKSIANQQDSFKNTVIVLPSQRAGVFIKQELKSKVLLVFYQGLLILKNLLKKFLVLPK